MHASAVDEMWQVDTADMRTFNEKGNKDTHVLVAVDIFSRKTRAEPMRGASADEALQAFKQWEPFPQAIDTDDGTEFKGVFAAFLEKEGIQHRVKDPKDVNATAVVERRIQSLKKAISGMMMEGEHRNWVNLLDSVVKGINEAPTDALHGKAPEDVAGDENVIFDTQKMQAEKAMQLSLIHI